MLPLLLLPQAAYTCIDRQPSGEHLFSSCPCLHCLIAVHDAEHNVDAATAAHICTDQVCYCPNLSNETENVPFATAWY